MHREGRRASDSAGVAALVAFGLGGGLAFTSRATFVATFHDDAFYYLTIARHAAAGHGITFDGLHATSGFHPLWLALLVPIFALGAGDVAALVVTHAAEIALVAGAAALAYATLAPRIGRPAAACGALLPAALPGAVGAMRGGMEGALVLFLLVATWRAWLALRDDAAPRTSRWIALGALGALLVLARLDAAIALAGLALLERRRLREAPSRAIALLAPAALVALVHLAILRATTGAWLPVNALVKRELARGTPLLTRALMALDVPWPGERVLAVITGGPLWWGPAWSRALDAALLALVALAAWRWRRAWIPRALSGGAAFPAVAGASMTLVVMTGVGLIQDWYLPPMLLAMGALAAAIVAPSPRASRVLALACVAVLLARPAWTWVDLRRRPAPFTVERLATADWIASNARGPVGAWDAGILGYFSHRSVVALDGLVNDVPFFESVIRGGRIDDYLRAQRIDLLAIPTCADAPAPPRPDFATLAYRARDPRGCPGDAVFRRDAE